MTRRNPRRALGRQLAIGTGRDAFTGVGLPITPDEDGDQLDLLEQAAATQPPGANPGAGFPSPLEDA